MDRLRYYLDALVHFLSANSRHGTHSPFVYRLVDEVIYAQRRADEPADKIERLTKRLIDRYAPSAVHRLEDGSPVKDPLDFVIADTDYISTVCRLLDQHPSVFHTGSIWVLLGMYRDTKTKALWRFIKDASAVTVTVDLFHVGLVFFHKGQAKEDFKINY